MKFIRQDLTSRRDETQATYLFSLSPGELAGLCLQHMKSLLGTSQQSSGLNSLGINIGEVGSRFLSPTNSMQNLTFCF